MKGGGWLDGVILGDQAPIPKPEQISQYYLRVLEALALAPALVLISSRCLIKIWIVY